MVRIQLLLVGLALPAVPLAGVVESYTLDLLPDGSWVVGSAQAALRLEVTALSTCVRALAPGIVVAGRPILVGDGLALLDGDTVQSRDVGFRFETTDRRYAGLLLREAGVAVAVSAGAVVELGRDPARPGLRLPERSGQHNIRWCHGARAEKARGHGFTLETALTGRRHAAVRIDGDRAILAHLHHQEAFVTCVQRGGAKGLERVERERDVELRSGDRIIVGTAVVLVRSD